MMTLYRIFNQTNINIRIEDIGITVPSLGSVDINSDLASRSSDLLRMKNKKLIRTDIIYIKQDTVDLVKATIAYESDSIPKTNNTKDTDTNLDELNKKVDAIFQFVSKFSQIMDDNNKELQSVQSKLKSITVVPFRPGMEHAHEIAARSDSDPVFIPNKIVPSDAKVSLSPQEASMDKDLSRAKNSLAKLRGKK